MPSRAYRRVACLLAVLAGLATACARELDLPPRPGGDGQARCRTGADCASGVCGGGFCCAATCGPTETCASPAAPGQCVARVLGDPCESDPACPSGFCVDGVCCETRCTGTCLTCNRAGAPGQCRPEEDNHDDAAECGRCGACFRGVCAPALAGTDPNKACLGELVCGPDQRCGARGGQSCGSDDDCAVGACIAGHCLVASVERVFVDPMNDGAQARVPRALAASYTGEVAVVFDEVGTQVDGDVRRATENDLFVALRSPEGAWSARRLQDDPCGDGANGESTVAGAAYLGPSLFVTGYAVGATEYADRCAIGNAPVGLFGQIVTPGGQVGRPEVADAAVRRELWHEAYTDDTGALVLVRQDVTGVTAMRRTIAAGMPPAWTRLGEPVALDPGVEGWVSALVGHRPFVFVTDDAGALWVRPFEPGAAPQPLALPADCVPALLFARTDADAAGPFVQLGFTCHLSLAYFGVWRPGATPPSWSFEAMPERVFATVPLGRPPFAAGDTVAAYLDVSTRPATGEAGLAWRGADKVWHLRTAFVPGGTDQVSRLMATTDADGLPVLLVCVGSSGPAFLAPCERLFLVRYHP